MRTAHVTARRPAEVAREVEALVSQGCQSFAIASIDRGGMFDLERLGAARYAAGIQVRVVLEPEETPAAAAAAR